MAEFIERKVHKKTRTVVEEEDIEVPEMEEVVNVSYISNSHTVSGDSTLGMLIVNFLVHGRRSAVTNVVAYGQGGVFESLYNMDLHSTINSLGLGPDIILAVSGFENEWDALTAVSALERYLASYSAHMPHEDWELLESAKRYLTERAPPTVTRAVALPSVRTERGVVRESVGEAVPVLRPVSLLPPVPAQRPISRPAPVPAVRPISRPVPVPASRPERRVSTSPVRSKRTKRTVVEEEDDTTSEEEVVDVIRTRRR